MLTLQDPITNLPFVGTKYATILNKLEIKSVKDLLYHFPFRYEDSSNLNLIDEAKVGETYTFTGTLHSLQNIRLKSGKTIQKGLFTDASGTLEVTWFNQPFLANTLKKTPQVSLTGKVTIYRNRPTLTSPIYEIITGTHETTQTPQTIHTGRIVPIYPLTSGLTAKWLRRRIHTALKAAQIEDWLPPEIIDQEKFLPLSQALKQIHFPDSFDQLTQAKQRLGFDELFLLQLAAQRRKHSWHQKHSARPLAVTSQQMNIFISHLPFNLTPSQSQSLNEIIADLKRDLPMNRLLQGDVGAGKTVLAAAAAYISSLNGLTTVFMAPTEILAVQHAQTLKQFLSPLGINISLQTRHHQDDLNQPVIVGTHAVLHRQLPDRLGVVIIDEQHRFGVSQRAKLLDQKQTPHTLSMTATPIPRTIALTLYADLDVSSLTHMPPGRLPVKTWVVPQKKRRAAYDWITGQIQKHSIQAFIVCPLINDSDAAMLNEVKAVTPEFERLQQKVFPQLKLGLLHSQLKNQQKDTVINQFKLKKLDILVTTPVIEVGVDIPNASIMVIESAERFGLASLHQLRGRVGRSDQQSYCLLFTTHANKTKRLSYLETTHSGLKLAELDLKLRGPGELHGLKQSGHIELKVASLNDASLIQSSYRRAQHLLKTDPNLNQHPSVAATLKDSLANQVAPN